MSTGFSPTQAELGLVNALFAQGDPNKVGILTGDVAVKLFAGAKLSPQVLGEVWAIADEENNGWLSRKSTALAVRLMGHAQAGDPVTKSLISSPGPLPNIEGISPITQHNTGASLMKPTATGTAGIPTLTPQDRTKFQNMFFKSGPVNGLLSGEKARDIFVKSKLPNDKLLQIWNLADTQDRGALDATDFAVGMYFIQGVMSGTISFIPTMLPPGLYQQAGGGGAPSGPPSVRAHPTGGSANNFSPIQSAFPQNRVQTQYTGQAPQLPARPPASAFGSSAFGQPASSSVPWDVTPAEKANADRFFDNLDSSRKGYIEGDVAVPFMLESKLPEDDLAQVWDLADLNNDGRLTRDGFAVAMHLIQKKLTGTPIPSSLPTSLVPPSMRGTIGQSPFSPPATQQQHQQPPEPPKDLFSWDDDLPATSTMSASNTGSVFTPLAPQPTGQMSRQLTGQQPPPPQPTSNFASPVVARPDPFGPSMSSSAKNLLDDDDTITSPPHEDKSAEIGNVQNQLNSTNKSLETTKAERAAKEQEIANQAGQLSALETQLSSARVAYETETKLLSTLRDRYNTQNADISKVREELIRAESDLSAIRVEKSEIEGSFLRDKEEARDLHRKMIEAGQQVDGMKAEVEKLKKEAKQQKGRLAIARKQLSTKEAERAKAQKEADEAAAELTSATVDAEAAEAELTKIDTTVAAPAPAPATLAEPILPTGPERALSADSITFAASQALPSTPEISTQSPTISVASGKSNNPFERLAMGGGSGSRSASPFQANPTESSPLIVSSPNGLAQQADVPKNDDPFGFSKAFESTESTSVPSSSTPTQANGSVHGSAPGTPKISAPIDITSPTSNSLLEPGSISPTASTNADTDAFVTPPSTANPSESSSKETSLAEAAEAIRGTPELGGNIKPDENRSSSEAHFPGHFEEISSTTITQPTEDKAIPVHDSTDLNSDLKEHDIEESDSSDDEDEVPLATLANKGKAPETVPAPADGVAMGNGAANPPGDSFNDIFGSSLSGSSEPPKAEAPPSTDAFGFPVDKKDDISGMTNGTASAAGVDAFDEAMGMGKKSNEASGAPFSFDNAFDDNFDFGAAGGTALPPTSTPTVNGNGPTPSATEEAKPTFDDVFNTSGPAPPSGAEPSASSPSGQAPAAQTTSAFDEAFSGFDTGPSLNLSNSLNAKPEAPDMTRSDSQPFPSVSTPTSPKTDASSPPRGSKGSSTGRPSSPPPRATSPRPTRPSTASLSKDGHDKKEPRSSKLSIRLPFGRKKKSHTAEPMPPPASFLTPPTEEPSSRTNTPAVDDDVEPVKQLTAMGFSRTQAIAALEKYSYDVPKALNSLLGQ